MVQTLKKQGSLSQAGQAKGLELALDGLFSSEDIMVLLFEADGEGKRLRFTERELAQEAHSADIKASVRELYGENSQYYREYEALCRLALTVLRQVKARVLARRGHNSHLAMISATDIKARLDIVEYISHYTELKKSGTRFYGKCPLHKDTSPSLFVYGARQDYYCYSCNTGGDILSFVMAYFKVEFKEALNILASEV